MGCIVSVTGEAIQFPDQDNVKQPPFAVLYHSLKLWPVCGSGRVGAVNVVLDHSDAVFLRVGGAFANLAFDGLLPLVVGGIAGIDDGGHGDYLSFPEICKSLI